MLSSAGAYQPDGNIWPFQALRIPGAGTWGTARYSLISLGLNALGAQGAQQGAETVFCGREAEAAAAVGRGAYGVWWWQWWLFERDRKKEKRRRESESDTPNREREKNKLTSLFL